MKVCQESHTMEFQCNEKHLTANIRWLCSQAVMDKRDSKFNLLTYKHCPTSVSHINRI